MKLSTEDKKNHVIQYNTYFFKNDEFEESYDGEISEMCQLLLVLKREVESQGLKRELILNFITERPKGLLAILTLLGISRETFLRLITFIRVSKSNELNTLVLKDKWEEEVDLQNFHEWPMRYIQTYIKRDNDFGLGIVNLLLDGGSSSDIRKSLPLFEYKKLDGRKLAFEVDSLLDTIVRYRNKGSYSADGSNNPEGLVIEALQTNNIPYERGSGFRNIVGRDIDFVIPNRKKPLILIESSYVVTTSSGMGDKASNEIAVSRKIKEVYTKVKFWGFVDGIGWYVRRGDLRNMVDAFENVYTFHPEDLKKFIADVQTLIK